MIKLKLSDFFSLFRLRIFLLLMNLLFVLDFYVYIINQSHIYEVDLKKYIDIEYIFKAIILISFYFVVIQILYYLVNLIIQLIKNKFLKNNEFKDTVSLNSLKFYSIKSNNMVMFNFFLRKEKELEDQYQEQVLAFGFVLFFIYSWFTNFNCFLLIEIKNNLLLVGIILLIFFYCFYISLIVPIDRNYIYDKKLKDIIKDEK